MGKQIIILVVGTIIGYGLTNLTLNEYTSQGTQNSTDSYSYNQAHDIANSMVDIIIMRMANDGLYRVNAGSNRKLFGGYVTYQTNDLYFEGDSLTEIVAAANYNGVSKSVSAFIKVINYNNLSPPIPVKAAITTNNPVKTNGKLIVDGRNHDLFGNFISDNGKLGIWSTGSVKQSGNSKIGGTVGSLDYAPLKPAHPSTIEQNQTWPDGVTNTPDKVMGGSVAGYPEGTLKNAAISGFDGSQYVTNPTSLTYPLKGITYVELPPGSEWRPARLDGEGILIVHNSSSNAIVKNTDSGYRFTGLMIVDDLIHLHSTVIGSVFILTPFPSSGNVIGNGKGKVLYSREALVNAIIDIEKQVKTQYGFRKKRLAVKYWFE